MKKLVLLTLFAITSAASAATVGITTGTPAQTIKLSGAGNILPTAWIRVGFFTNLAAVDFATQLADPTPGILNTIATNFIPLGEPSSAAGYGTPAGNSIDAVPVPGAVDGSMTLGGAVNDATFVPGTANTVVAGGVPRGTRLFLLIYDSQQNPTELGIFSATNWLVPASSLVNTANLTLTGVDVNVDGATDEVFRGNLAGALILAPIPEPSAGLLAMAASLGLMLRRKR